jgi:hypothetical protein
VSENYSHVAKGPATSEDHHRAARIPAASEKRCQVAQGPVASDNRRQVARIPTASEKPCQVVQGPVVSEQCHQVVQGLPEEEEESTEGEDDDRETTHKDRRDLASREGTYLGAHYFGAELMRSCRIVLRYRWKECAHGCRTIQ